MATNNKGMIIPETIEDKSVVVKEALDIKPSQPLPEPKPGVGPIKPVELPPRAKLPEPNKEEGTARTWLDSQKAEDFGPFLVAEIKRITPPHACGGNRSAIERSRGQLATLDGHISKALRGDYDGKLDVSNIDKLRSQIHHSLETADKMLDAFREMAKGRRQVRRKASDNSACTNCQAPLWEDEGGVKVCLACDADGLKKEAGLPIFNGYQVQTSAFEHAITSILINATVSGGRNMEEMYKKLKDKYGFTDREELAILQIIADKGFPVFKDRAVLGEDEDVSDPKKQKEWLTNYYA